MADITDDIGIPVTQLGYELRYFARKHGLTTAQANDILRRYGSDRAKLNAAAVKLRRSGKAGVLD